MFETTYGLTEDQLAMRQLAREIAQEKIKPVAAKYDEENSFPWPIVKILADAGLFGCFIEEKYGGTGGGVLDLCLITEELCRTCGGISLSLAATALGTFPIILYGNEEQKKKYLTEIAAGRKLAAFALTEADAGSDASGIQTTATKDGDYYVLNGTKFWITNATHADTLVVYAKTSPEAGSRGITAFLIEKDIVTIPGTEQAQVEESPPYNRQNSAYIDIPGPYEKGLPSVYYISPPDPAWDKATQDAFIPGKKDLLFTSVHEVWPGHFLQFLHSNRNPSLVGCLFVGYAFAEGWAHYAEEMMWEREPLERLVADGQLVAYEHGGFWKAMDTLRDKLQIEALWENGRAPWKNW